MAAFPAPAEPRDWLVTSGTPAPDAVERLLRSTRPSTGTEQAGLWSRPSSATWPPTVSAFCRSKPSVRLILIPDTRGPGSFTGAMGFEPLEEITGLWPPGNPCLIMVKLLGS